MRPKLLFIAIMALLASCNSNEPIPIDADNAAGNDKYLVEIDEAIKIADSVLAQLDAQNGKTRASGRYLSSIEAFRADGGLTRSNNDNPDFYLLNYADDGGFALLAADRRKGTSIYAFSDEGNLNLADTVINEGLNEYINTLSILPPVIQRPDTFPLITGTLRKLVQPILPEPVRNWDQISLNKYVQYKCGEKTPVGCGALACGMIMSHYQWPDRWPVKGYETASERYQFDWNIIRTKRSNDYTYRLLEILGRPENLNISYNLSGSSTYGSRISPTFVNMGYEACKSGKYNTHIVLETLFNNNPIIVTGRGGGEGHAWAIDGVCEYKEAYTNPNTHQPIVNLYYHFVWGNWGGSNGYYYYDQSNDSFALNARFSEEGEKENPGLTSIHSGIYIYYDFKKKINL